MKQNKGFDPILDIRCTLSEVCSNLFNIKCNENHVLFHTMHSDAALRIAYSFSLDAEKCAAALTESKDSIRLYDNVMIESVMADNNYINITFDNYFLENIAEKVIAALPKMEILEDINCDYEYAVIRTHMLSNKNSSFAEAISNVYIRRAFFDSLLILSSRDTKKQRERAAATWMNAECNIHHMYDKLGKAADSICRLLCAAK